VTQTPIYQATPTIDTCMMGSCAPKAYLRSRRNLKPLMSFLSVCGILSAQALSAGAAQATDEGRTYNIRLTSFSCSSSSITGAGTDTCTVTLSGAARNRLNLSLASNNAAVTVPATVTVPVNETSAQFTAHASAVNSAESVTLTATLDGSSQRFVIELLDATQPTLTISPSSLVFGNVTVNTASTLPVTLSSTGTAAVTINSAKLSGTGFTMSGGATFPVTLNPGLALTLNVQFDPTVTGAATGQLAVQSNSATSASAVIGLSGTGESAPHQVSLTWSAPASSPAPVVGYYVYRSSGGSSAYQQLNSSVDTQTTYVDSTVQAGLTYDYLVESVDAAGVESNPSGSVAATVP
jgi:Abnormal spindle-like microcephaly-assoc'd, ASPM-SPD-2-Hydin